MNIQKDKKCLVAVPTFRRPHFLPRILACFNRLKYENKKMVIINDDPETRYFYDDPKVDIINIDKHIPLSVKRNMFPSWEFDIMFPLDDDDLFLPDRINNHLSQYNEDPELELYRNNLNYLITDSRIIIPNTGSGFHNCSYTRAGFFKSGGYTGFQQSNLDDISFSDNMSKNCKVKVDKNFKLIDYVYDFNGHRYHNSGNNHFLMSEIHDEITKRQRPKTGDITLKPDYECYDNIHRICAMVSEIEGLPIKTSPESVNIELDT